MRCPDLYQWELFVDGEIPSFKRLQMEAHLKDCPLCSRLVAGLREEVKLFAESLASTPVPPELDMVINKRLAGRGSQWLIWFFLAVMGIIGALGAINEGWWLFEKVGEISRLFVGSGFPLQLALFFSGFVFELAGLAMKGNPVLPALALLVVCALWTRLKLLRGGRTYV